jgi:antitoxin Phd
MKTWQVQEAKAKFSELIRLAIDVPQYITVRGEPTVVIIAKETYESLKKPQPNLYEFLQNSPFKDIELNLARNKSIKKRKINL